MREGAWICIKDSKSNSSTIPWRNYVIICIADFQWKHLKSHITPMNTGPQIKELSRNRIYWTKRNFTTGCIYLGVETDCLKGKPFHLFLIFPIIILDHIKQNASWEKAADALQMPISLFHLFSRFQQQLCAPWVPYGEEEEKWCAGFTFQKNSVRYSFSYTTSFWQFMHHISFECSRKTERQMRKKLGGEWSRSDWVNRSLRVTVLVL